MAKKNISYTEAMAEIELIISQIEDGDLDVDNLGEKVKRVTSLIKLCRERLHKTEKEINEILSEEDEDEK